MARKRNEEPGENAPATKVRTDVYDMGRDVTVEKMAKGLGYSGSMNPSGIREVNSGEEFGEPEGEESD